MISKICMFQKSDACHHLAVNLDIEYSERLFKFNIVPGHA